MSYTKQNFTNGDILPAEQLNNIEAGIVAVEEDVVTLQEEVKRLKDVCPVIDDTTVGADAWSSKNIVDKLCPAFTESGAVVTCEPLEGYPLEVASRTKNLIPFPYEYDSRTINGVTFIVNEDGSVTVNGTATANATFWLSNHVYSAGTYTLSCDGITSNKECRAECINTDGTTMYLSANGTYSINEDATIRVYLVILSGEIVSNLTLYPQLELGSVATSYSPYNIAPTVNHLGKNLVDDIAFFTQCGFTLQEDGRWFGKSKKASSPLFVNTSGATGRFTFSMEAQRVEDLNSIAIVVAYADGKNSYHYPGAQSGGGRFVSKTTAGKVVTDMSWTYAKSGTFYVKDMQLEYGDSNTDYEPYKGEVYENVDGECTVTAYPGINTIYSDAGNVTVTGRKNPIAVIKSQEERIAALEDTLTALLEG